MFETEVNRENHGFKIVNQFWPKKKKGVRTYSRVNDKVLQRTL
jgi:hypothetical protein